MSAPQSTFPKRGLSTLSLNIAPRFPTFQIDCVSSNKENHPEVSTPQLPKKTPFNSKATLSLRKSNFSSQQCPQQSENPIEISFDKASPIEFNNEPNSALFRKKEAEMSFCENNSPLVLDVPSFSLLESMERDYNEDLYRRAEEYLDSLHFVIVLPEDYRRKPFRNLKISTAKTPSSDSSTSEYSSPTITPSIHTSSLFLRRSSSKKMDSGGSPKQKQGVSKSPFYNCPVKGKRLFAVETNLNKEAEACIEIDEDSGAEKFVVTSLNVKFTGMSLRASREPSDTSVTSFKIEENSPLKIIL